MGTLNTTMRKKTAIGYKQERKFNKTFIFFAIFNGQTIAQRYPNNLELELFYFKEFLKQFKVALGILKNSFIRYNIYSAVC